MSKRSCYWSLYCCSTSTSIFKLFFKCIFLFVKEFIFPFLASSLSDLSLVFWTLPLHASSDAFCTVFDGISSTVCSLPSPNLTPILAQAALWLVRPHSRCLPCINLHLRGYLDPVRSSWNSRSIHYPAQLMYRKRIPSSLWIWVSLGALGRNLLAGSLDCVCSSYLILL